MFFYGQSRSGYHTSLSGRHHGDGGAVMGWNTGIEAEPPSVLRIVSFPKVRRGFYMFFFYRLSISGYTILALQGDTRAS